MVQNKSFEVDYSIAKPDINAEDQAETNPEDEDDSHDQSENNLEDKDLIKIEIKVERQDNWDKSCNNLSNYLLRTRFIRNACGRLWYQFKNWS